MQHVATWREGDDKWAYHEDAWKYMATHKVSLDPYRMESRKILACIEKSRSRFYLKILLFQLTSILLEISLLLLLLWLIQLSNSLFFAGLRKRLRLESDRLQC